MSTLLDRVVEMRHRQASKANMFGFYELQWSGFK